MATVGVLSILEGELAVEAKRLWKLFETDYGSTGVQTFDYPNVTFQAGTCQDIAVVRAALVELSRSLQPVTIRVDGLDYFDGAGKVIFLNVLLTDELRQVNQRVNQMLMNCCESVFENYKPDTWRPHITVAMTDLTDENFARAWADLRDYHPRYQHITTNISLVYVDQRTGHIEIAHREPLSSA